MPARPSILVTLIVAALPLGCGSRIEMALVDPTKYQFYNCAQLAREMKELTERAHELQALQAKARLDDAGAFVARVAYEPDYLTTTGNMELVETAAKDRDCGPPIVATVRPPAR